MRHTPPCLARCRGCGRKTFHAATTQAPFLPHGREDFQVLLDAYLLEKAIYELGYELNNRPDWVRVPLAGILHLLEPER
jgi:maltose alpha-D-glucosyltransferase/alpha-amylase